MTVLVTRQQNIASRHPRLSGIGRRNKLNSKKDSLRVVDRTSPSGSPRGVAPTGMTELGYLNDRIRVFNCQVNNNLYESL